MVELDPTIALTESTLRMAFSNPTLKASYQKYLRSGTDTDLELFLVNFQLLVTPVSLGGLYCLSFKTKNKHDVKILQGAAEAGEYLDSVNESIVKARSTYTNNMFAEPIQVTDRSFPNLLQLSLKIKHHHSRVLAKLGELPEGKTSPSSIPYFVDRCVCWIFESGVVSSGRWSVQNMLEERAFDNVQTRSSELVTCFTDPLPKITAAMIARFNTVFRFPTIKDFSTNYRLQVKFVRASSLLLEAVKEAQDVEEVPEDYLKKVVPFWVKAAYTSYSEIIGTGARKSENVPRALGFLAGTSREEGNTAKARFNNLVKDAKAEGKVIKKKNTINRKIK